MTSVDFWWGIGVLEGVRLAHTHSDEAEEMVGCGGSDLESQHLIGWGRGISVRKELEQKKKNHNRAGSWVCHDHNRLHEVPVTTHCCPAAYSLGVCWSLQEVEGCLGVVTVRAEWEGRFIENTARELSCSCHGRRLALHSDPCCLFARSWPRNGWSVLGSSQGQAWWGGSSVLEVHGIVHFDWLCSVTIL